eukprot:Skav223493  [mRNA]  locus=scaffold1160:49858:54081:- [translate_table: standard]
MAQTIAVGALLGAASTAFLAPGNAPALRGAGPAQGSARMTGTGAAQGAMGGLAAGGARGGVASGGRGHQLPSSSGEEEGSEGGARQGDGDDEIPWNLFSPKAPYTGKVVKNDFHPQTLTEPTGDANWETTHVTFDHGGKVPYIEGQSIGVIAPGPDKKGEQPAKIRLYSIASSAVGDDQTSKTVSLCVKRVVELDGKFSNRAKGEDKPDKAGTAFPDNEVYRGVCSNHICDSWTAGMGGEDGEKDMSEGDDVLITGPTGAEMLLPEDPEANIIMLATGSLAGADIQLFSDVLVRGTGIAPMRSYLRLWFHEKAVAAADGSRKFKGLAWLFMGASAEFGDWQFSCQEYPDQFKYDYAVSREDKNAAGQKMFLASNDKKTHVYMCGLKGMESGMAECFGPIAEKNGIVWTEFAKAMKKADRYHVEVY